MNVLLASNCCRQINDSVMQVRERSWVSEHVPLDIFQAADVYMPSFSCLQIFLLQEFGNASYTYRWKCKENLGTLGCASAHEVITDLRAQLHLWSGVHGFIEMLEVQGNCTLGNETFQRSTFSAPEKVRAHPCKMCLYTVQIFRKC